MASTLPIEVIRGESSAINVVLRDENDKPINLTSMTEFVAKVHAATGSPIEAKFSISEVVVVGDPLLGEVQIKYTAVKTALFGLTNYDADTNPNYTTLQIEVTITGMPDFNPNIKKIEGALNIIDPIS